MRSYTTILLLAAILLTAVSSAHAVVVGYTGGGQPHSNMQPSLGVNHIIAVTGLYPSRDKEEGAKSEPFLGEIGMFAGNFAPRGWALCDGQILPIAQNDALFSLLGTTYGGDGRTTFALPDLRGRTAIHPGTGPGLTRRYLGEASGVETVTLTEAQMPTHTHTLPWGGDPTFTTGGGQAHTNMQPYLGINYNIALWGIFPSRNKEEEPKGDMPFIAEIGMFAGNFAPRGYANLDGQLLPIVQNEALFSLLGTTYGGDGRTTFALPDLRGRAAVHAGTGPGLSQRHLGDSFGVENVTISGAQMPSHHHSLLPTALLTGDTGGGQEHTEMQPSLALDYIIALEGTYPSRDKEGEEESAKDADPFIGQIDIFAGNFAPRGWALCDGQLLPIAQYTALFSLLGTTYGGDGRTTFALPDLRGRTPIHPGTGPGLTNRRLGESFGLEDCALTVDQLPSHTHEIPEPATGSLCLLALAGLTLRPRRRKCTARRSKG